MGLLTRAATATFRLAGKITSHHPRIPMAKAISSRFPHTRLTTLDELMSFVESRNGADIMFYIRHGEAEGGGSRPIFYSNGEGPLTPRGHQQIETLAHLISVIKKYNPFIFSSSAERAEQSKDSFTTVAELETNDLAILDELREIGVGDLKGDPLTIAEALKDPAVIRKAAPLCFNWFFNMAAFTFPGERGESAVNAQQRAITAYKIIHERAPDRFSVVFGHEVWGRFFMAYLLNCPIENVRMAPILQNAGFAAIDLAAAPEDRLLYIHNPDGKVRLVT